MLTSAVKHIRMKTESQTVLAKVNLIKQYSINEVIGCFLFKPYILIIFNRLKQNTEKHTK